MTCLELLCRFGYRLHLRVQNRHSVKELIDLLDVERVSKYFVAQAFSYLYVYTQSRLSLDLSSIIYILDKAKMSSHHFLWAAIRGTLEEWTLKSLSTNTAVQRH